MKIVNVVAAIICDDYKKKTKIFATQRGYGEFKDGWEFPGGKIEEGETPQQALVREIHEELGAEIEVHDLIDVIDYDYEKFHLHMNCYDHDYTGHLCHVSVPYVSTYEPCSNSSFQRCRQ